MEENQNLPPRQPDKSKDLFNKSPEEQTDQPQLEFNQPGNIDTQGSLKQPEQMEVHKHPHHVTHKKKWGEYILEFLMIFLAVFLGFIAENLRENSVEHNRARQYAQLLYDEIKKDTAELKLWLNFKIWRGKKIDSLVDLINSPGIQEKAGMVYHYHWFSWVNVPFKPSDITIQQLRNTGTLRYFKDLKLYNTITQYYSDCSGLLEVETNVQKIPQAIISKIFNARKLNSLMWVAPDIRDAVRQPAKDVDYKLLIADGQILNEYLLDVGNIKVVNDLCIFLLNNRVGKDQQMLMDELRQEFHVN